MSAKVEVQGEALVADVALVWFFACVDQLMSLELRVIQEPLVATLDLTNEHSFTMSHLMLPVAALIVEHF